MYSNVIANRIHDNDSATAEFFKKHTVAAETICLKSQHIHFQPHLYTVSLLSIPWA